MQADASTASPQLKVDQGKTGWSCWDMHEVDAAERTAIAKAANDAADAIKRSDFDALWNGANPALRDTYERDPVIKTFQTITAFLKDAPLPAEPADIKVVRGEVKPGAWVYCWLQKPKGYLWRTALGGKDPRALVLFRFPQAVLLVELRQADGRWGFFFADVTPAVPGGRSADGFAAAAESALKKGDKWLAAVLYIEAEQMLGISNSVFTHEQKAMDEKLGPLLADAALREQFQHWSVEGKDYKVLRTAFTITSEDRKLFVIFSYQTALVLDKAPLEKEGRVLLKWLQTNHGDLAKHVDGVVFEAVREVNQGGATPSYRTVLHFK